jgi:Na+-driven multidrug efflux pump
MWNQGRRDRQSVEVALNTCIFVLLGIAYAYGALGIAAQVKWLRSAGQSGLEDSGALEETRCRRGVSI